MSSHKLAGKVALITGCSGGIGRTTALTLARLGCSVAIHYNQSKGRAEKILFEIKSLPNVTVNAVIFQADLSSYDEVRRLHKEVDEKIGHPDILFNNAGVGRVASIEGVEVEEFEETWRVNVGSGYLLTQLCLHRMQEQRYGRIVFCSSVAAGNGGRIGPHYASSKSALHGLLHWIAMRYAPIGITCNAVAPGRIAETGMLSNPTEQQRISIPVRRFGLPEDIAVIVEMLILNSYMTNKIIVADGGLEPTAF